MNNDTTALMSAYSKAIKSLGMDYQKLIDSSVSAAQAALSASEKQFELNKALIEEALKALENTIRSNEQLLRSAAENMSFCLDSFIQCGTDILDEIKDSEDYIIVDEKPIKEIDISETIAIPIGNNRVRIKTSDFINIIAVILTALSLVKSFISTADIQTTQQIIEVTQEQNEILNNLLDSTDLSNSSVPEYLESWKEYALSLHSEVLELTESVQSLQSELSDLKDTVQVQDSAFQVQSSNPVDSEPTTDNTNKSSCTASEN